MDIREPEVHAALVVAIEEMILSHNEYLTVGLDWDKDSREELLKKYGENIAMAFNAAYNGIVKK